MEENINTTEQAPVEASPAPAPESNKSGMVVALIVVALLAIVGAALWMRMTSPSNEVTDASIEELRNTSDSTELGDLESELDFNLDDADTEVQNDISTEIQ